MALRVFALALLASAVSAQFPFSRRFIPSRFGLRSNEFSTVSPFTTLAPFSTVSPYTNLAPVEGSTFTASPYSIIPTPTPEITVESLSSVGPPAVPADVAIRPRYPFRSVYRRPVFQTVAPTFAPTFAPRFASPEPVPVIPAPAPARIAYSRPIARLPVPIPEYDDGPAVYNFRYDINAPETGDVKNQQEQRENDAVQGSYSFVQPDGLLRIVEYTANDATGFNAVVRYEDAGARFNIPGPAYAARPTPFIIGAGPVAASALPEVVEN